jgi:hypothetical protein
MQDLPMFEAYVPGFSGIVSSGWAALISGPRQRAAENPDMIKINDYVLDAADFLKIFDETADELRQRTEIARLYSEIFSIQLMAAHGIGRDLEFQRYEADADRAVALVSFPTVLRIVELCARTKHGKIVGALPDGFVPLRDLALWDDHEVEKAVGRLQSLDRSAFGELLRAVRPPGWKMSATEIENLADDALEYSTDWQKFWSAVEKRYREKPLSGIPGGRR